MKEWYMENYTPNITGFESCAISQYAQDNFTDVLLTNLADDLLLCSHDLSVKTPIRGIIQGNMADTQLQSMYRTILCKIGTVHAGDYIYFDDNYWIIDGLPGNNKSYEKVTLKVCQYKLRWQKDDGTIVERWGNFSTASKYDKGENGNEVATLSSNNYTILIPEDDDGMTIERRRVFIDISQNPEKVFKITRNDDPLFMYNSKGGVLSLIADKEELNLEKDRPDLRLCDYIDPETPPSFSNGESGESDISAMIKGPKDILVGFPQKYTALFKSVSDESDIDFSEVDFSWNIIGDDRISHTERDDIIAISVNDEDLIGSSFLLQLLVKGSVLAELPVKITEGW